MQLIFWCQNPTGCKKEGLHSIPLLLLMSCTAKKKKKSMDMFDLLCIQDLWS